MYDPFMNQNQNNQNQDTEKQDAGQASVNQNSTASQETPGSPYYSQSYSQNYSQPNGYNAPNYGNTGYQNGYSQQSWQGGQTEWDGSATTLLFPDEY